MERCCNFPGYKIYGNEKLNSDSLISLDYPVDIRGDLGEEDRVNAFLDAEKNTGRLE